MHKDVFISMSAVSVAPPVNPHLDDALAEAPRRLRPLLASSAFFLNAKFSWILLTFVLGEESSLLPEYVGQSRKYGDIDFRLRLRSRDLIGFAAADLSDLFTVLGMDVIKHVGSRYGLDWEPVLASRGSYLSERVRRLISASGDASAGRPVVSDDSESCAELHLKVPLSSEFGTREERDVLDALDLELARVCEQVGGASLDTRETGGGEAVFILLLKEESDRMPQLIGAIQSMRLPPGTQLLHFRAPDDPDEEPDLIPLDRSRR